MDIFRRIRTKQITNLYLNALSTASLVQMVTPAQFDNNKTDIKIACRKREVRID